MALNGAKVTAYIKPQRYIQEMDHLETFLPQTISFL